MTMPAGLHIVTKRKRGKPITYYVYAWRGGPQILVKVGGAKPEVTAELSDMAAEKRKSKPVVTISEARAPITRPKRPAMRKPRSGRKTIA